MKPILLNPEPDGTCRTIKANYYKVSLANFLRRGSMGATGVMAYELEDTAADKERLHRDNTALGV